MPRKTLIFRPPIWINTERQQAVSYTITQTYDHTLHTVELISRGEATFNFTGVELSLLNRNLHLCFTLYQQLKRVE